MVCVPCIILPVLLAIYLKFIQPFILRFIPERWRTAFDTVLYPTCPVKMPPKQESNDKESSAIDNDTCCAGDDESKKDL